MSLWSRTGGKFKARPSLCGSSSFPDEQFDVMSGNAAEEYSEAAPSSRCPAIGASKRRPAGGAVLELTGVSRGWDLWHSRGTSKFGLLPCPPFCCCRHNAVTVGSSANIGGGIGSGDRGFGCRRRTGAPTCRRPGRGKDLDPGAIGNSYLTMWGLALPARPSLPVWC